VNEVFEVSKDLQVIPAPLALVVLLEQWVLSVPLVLLDRRERKAQREILVLKAILEKRVRLVRRVLLGLRAKVEALGEERLFQVLLGLKESQGPRVILGIRVRKEKEVLRVFKV
jgi:hypothetical protein